MDQMQTPETGVSRQPSPLGRYLVPLIILLTLLAFSLTVIPLISGQPPVFQDLLALPLILTCLLYPRWGLLLTAGVSLSYILLVSFFARTGDILLPALERSAFWLLLGAIVSIVSRFRLGTEARLRAARRETEKQLEEGRRLEKAYRDIKEYYELLFRHTEAGIAVLNSESYVTMVNPAFERLTGRPKSDLVGRKLSAVVPLENADPEGKALTFVTNGIDKAGQNQRTLWCLSTVAPDEGGIPVATVAIGHIIHEGDF